MVFETEDIIFENKVKNEIQDLHLFFELWFTGKIDAAKLNRFSDVIDEDFYLITPNGMYFNYNQIVSLVKENFNSTIHRRIWVSEVKTRKIGDYILATYYENQQDSNSLTKRISSALFKYHENKPNNCIWLFVHETWLNDS